MLRSAVERNRVFALFLSLLVFPAFSLGQTPSISGISPNPAAIGTSVTISGTNFGSTAGSVKFNGTTASSPNWGSTSITVAVPSGATSGDVVVTTSGGVPSSGFTFIVAPKISSLSPSSAITGTAITISGSGFGSSTGTVTFNGTTAATSSWTNLSISATVPTAATTGNVVVTTAAGLASAGVNFVVRPKINGISPSSGTPGTPVTLTGSGFGAAPGSVWFGSVQASITSWTTTSIDTIVPPGVTSSSLVVNASGIDSNNPGFSIPRPTVDSFFPLSGRYGNSITITGTNFGTINAPATVKFNGTPATAASTWTNTTIVAAVPTGASTGPITVTPSFNGPTFTVIPPPSISQLSPNTGPSNTVVTITGVGFGSPQGTSTITFNGVNATPTSWNNTTIVVPVPAGATTGNVVITAGGQVSPGVSFTVAAAPSISSLIPNTGAAGTSVTIAGNNFGSSQGSSVVRFNGIAADISNWSNTSINAVAPAAVSTGPVTVTVSAQASNGVTFTAVTTGTLSGSITRSSDGSNVNGALVEALQDGGVKFSANSNSGGSYSISNIDRGTYDLRVSASSLGSALRNAIVVPAGQTTTQSFSLSSAGSITGVVTQADGTTPISGATVKVFVGSAAGTGATSNGSGTYTINDLNADTYNVQASAAGYVSKTKNSVLVAGGSSATANFSLFTPGNGPINYAYDELGRLIAVSDATGDTAIYAYDAVGNILSIQRRNSSDVSIISFTPSSGLVGSSVTISGTGFSSTPSQNTVQFNGTAATVSSSTANQIVAVVPSGATSGTISVTSPAGSVASQASFTVLADSGAPTITSFTPDRGVSGNTITVTGTNFDTTPANNSLRLNISAQLVTSASGTSLATKVPAGTGSGKISLTTPKGKTSSTQDFYVPFGTHTVNDIAYTGRIAVGGSQVATLSTTNKIGLLLFEGVQNQKILIRYTNDSITGACTIYLFDPYNRQVTGSSCGGLGGHYVEAVTLPVSGTYVIGIEPHPTATAGSLTLTLFDVTDNVTFIQLAPGGGAGGPVTNTVPGQATRLYFTGYPGQRLSIKINSSSYTASPGFGNAKANVSIAGIDGNLILSPSEALANKFFDPDDYSNQLTLPTAGTYYVLVDPLTDAVGTLNLTIHDVPPDLTPQLGMSELGTLDIGVPGQKGLPIINLPEGAHISITYTFSGSSCSLKLLSPSGALIGLLTSCAAANGYLEIPYPLTAGQYTLWLKPTFGSTGTFNVTVNDATDASYNITPVATGTSVTVTNTVPGQNGKVTLTGAAGYKASAWVNSVNYPFGSFALLTVSGPSGTIDSRGASLNAFVDPDDVAGLNLSAGTYSLFVDPSTNLTGSTGLTVYYFQDVTGSVTVGGSALPVQTVAAGQNANITFAGTAGQQVTVRLTGNTFNSAAPTVALLRQNGSILTSGGSTQTSFNLTTQTLPATETYTIKINPQFRTTGNITVQVTTP